MNKKMNLNIFFIGVITISIFVSVFYLIKMIRNYYVYNQYNKKTIVTYVNWNIDKKEDNYLVSADYGYVVDNINHKGKGFFSKKQFINYFLALDYVDKIDKQGVKIWYSKKNLIINKIGPKNR